MNLGNTARRKACLSRLRRSVALLLGPGVAACAWGSSITALPADLLASVSATTGCEAADATAVQYVDSHEIEISLDETMKSAEQVALFVSTDRCRSWMPARHERSSAGALRYAAAADGRLDFFLVVHDLAGASSPPPVAGQAGHATVIVDTLEPTLQVHRMRVIGSRPADETSQPGIRVEWTITLIDEHLSASPLRVFYRMSSDGPWQDGGAARLMGRIATVVLPYVEEGPMDLMAVATDLAGNRAQHETRLWPQQPPADSTGRAVAAPAGRRRDSADDSWADAEPQPESVESTPQTEPFSPMQRAVLAQADEYLSQGRYALAIGRLELALGDRPHDAELLARLGDAFYATGRTDEARRSFEDALAAEPDLARALQGLAEVFRGQGRLHEARDLSERLVLTSPNCAVCWLRLGDLRQRAGNASAAIQAWRRARSLAPGDEALRQRVAQRLQTSQRNEVRPTP